MKVEIEVVGTNMRSRRDPHAGYMQLIHGGYGGYRRFSHNDCMILRMVYMVSYTFCRAYQGVGIERESDRDLSLSRPHARDEEN